MRSLRIELPKRIDTSPLERLPINKINRDSYDYVVLDFDGTLTRNHIFQLLNGERVHPIRLTMEPFLDKEYNMSVIELFRILKEYGKNIFIASRNYNDIVYQYVVQNIDSDFPRENIYTDRGNYWGERTFSGNSKMTAFRDILSQDVSPTRILYIDDTESDIKEAYECCYKETEEELQWIHKPMGVTMEKIVERIRE